MSRLLHELRLKIFADGADLSRARDLACLPYVAGFTTNPTLMRLAGVRDYASFARAFLAIAGDRAVSFEVLADDLAEMERQARTVASWGREVYVKIPITNTRGEATSPVLESLSAAGIRVNVTAVTTLEQVAAASAALGDRAPALVSVFAGRIADSGRDPMPIVAEAVRTLRRHPRQELLWASPREVLNVFQAESVGCHAITLTGELLAKLPLVGRDLERCSLDTVRMFHDDARAAGYRL